MHVVDGVPKKQIAERLGLDIKTVRRAVAQAAAPARRAVSRPRHLDRWRAQIEQWLRQDRRLTAKRIRRLLLPLAGPVAERTVRWYVARLKAAAAPKEVYVHRSPRPGVTLEVDFGESWADCGPPCPTPTAKAYPVERLESLLDGIQAAFVGGVTPGGARQHDDRGQAGADRPGPGADRCVSGVPGRVSVCGGVLCAGEGLGEGLGRDRHVCAQSRVPQSRVGPRSTRIITELEADVATRRLADGRPVREAWTLERRHLRPWRDGRVSVPTRYAYRPVWVKRITTAWRLPPAPRSSPTRPGVSRGAMVLDPLHVLPLERKHRAVSEATALQDWALAPVWQQVHRPPAADAQARSGVGPDVAAAGNLSRPGRRGGGRGRPRPRLTPARDRAPAVAPAGGWPPARDPPGPHRPGGSGPDRGLRPDVGRL